MKFIHEHSTSEETRLATFDRAENYKKFTNNRAGYHKTPSFTLKKN